VSAGFSRRHRTRGRLPGFERSGLHHRPNPHRRWRAGRAGVAGGVGLRLTFVKNLRNRPSQPRVAGSSPAGRATALRAVVASRQTPGHAAPRFARRERVRALPGALLVSREAAPHTLREAPRLAPARRERFRALPGALSRRRRERCTVQSSGSLATRFARREPFRSPPFDLLTAPRCDVLFATLSPCRQTWATDEVCRIRIRPKSRSKLQR